MGYDFCKKVNFVAKAAKHSRFLSLSLRLWSRKNWNRGRKISTVSKDTSSGSSSSMRAGAPVFSPQDELATGRSMPSTFSFDASARAAPSATDPTFHMQAVGLISKKLMVFAPRYRAHRQLGGPGSLGAV